MSPRMRCSRAAIQYRADTGESNCRRRPRKKPWQMQSPSDSEGSAFRRPARMERPPSSTFCLSGKDRGDPARFGSDPPRHSTSYPQHRSPRPATPSHFFSALTPSEARIFAKVGEGHELSAIADHLGVKLSTVKTHLLRVFEKTGTNRQADVVR